MGSISIAVERHVNTHDFVLDQVVSNLPQGASIVDHNRHATGDGKWDWSNVLFAAVRGAAGDVSLHVVLYRRDFQDGSSWITIKHLDETVGPTQTAGVTKRVLARLSPTANEYALNFRSEAVAWHERRKQARHDLNAAIGAIIKLPHSYNYGNHYGFIDTVKLISPTEFQHVTALADGRYRVNPAARLRAPGGWAQQGFTIVEPAA